MVKTAGADYSDLCGGHDVSALIISEKKSFPALLNGRKTDATNIH
ncbi:hypothetical protein Plano_0559 [Planococcus sp. PAMC 21323]|nr:hypothetical protein Plano_0559 [Planococcus sp. PAMC 21323]